MILEERLTAFINSLDEGNPAYLNELEKEARETNVPVIRTETQSLLRTLIAMKQPLKILEIGTAIGFSALCMSEYAPEGCHITTIEKYEKRIPIARENFRRFGKEDRITLLEGDAAQVLSQLTGPYELIFMDAAKAQYPVLLKQVLRLLSDGGLLVSDNVLQDGDILESRYAVTRRNRTIHARMREYLYEIKHHPCLVTSILPVGDGVAVSVARKEEEKKL
ncbi:MAG TPA: O-methyltransferase [Candidatus Eisenbergiella merdavium]|uniref:tRNA 5-hydroxyuridine methyltransferase n=1 Tax=Candidatus Eisenbergiella merdavium TaxID=2838551 RepID=A0A9D2NDA1_9FIRM|nr:O-methyltransferase [Candidatus Eisenbergiella merdavium]